MDKGRWIICEEIAKRFPYPVDEVYEVYEHVRNWQVKTGKVVIFLEQLSLVESVLKISNALAVKPINLARSIFVEPRA